MAIIQSQSSSLILGMGLDRHTGVVHQDIDRAEAIERGLGQCHDLGFVLDVGLDG
jgi:hypothetical protein